ncbi:hypothetical protein TNCV_1004241 [Trichonephila clavipes]|nr:hypothetical protein TNCV_1004241 [Trichonephila clavipes]
MNGQKLPKITKTNRTCQTPLAVQMGKHCRIQRPPNAGSLFYNYKDFPFNCVLLADADAYACFTMIEVGAYGKG